MNLEVMMLNPISSLDANKPYLIKINVGIMSREEVKECCKKVKEKLESLGIKRALIIPYRENDLLRRLIITEINDEVKRMTLELVKNRELFSREQAKIVEQVLARIGV